jgi:predicted Zn-dependent protease
MRLLARLFPAALAASLSLAAGVVCAQTELPDIGNPAAAAITVDEERQIGEMITKELRDQGKLVDDPEVY